MSVQLTVVPLAQKTDRGPIGVLQVPDGLTWVDASNGDLNAAAVACIAAHFGLAELNVKNVTATSPGAGWQAVLAHAGVLADGDHGVRLVCLLVKRRLVEQWFTAAPRSDVEWVPRNQAWARHEDAMAVEVALEATRELLRRTTLATVFVGPYFSLPDLRHIYDDLWQATLDPPNFQRRFATPTAGLLRPMPVVEGIPAEGEGEIVMRTRSSERRMSLSYAPPTDEERAAARRRGLGRPPQLWVAGDETRIEPPLMVPANAGWKPQILGPWQFEDLGPMPHET